MSREVCLPPGDPTPAAFPLPAGSCDCHAHVLGPFTRYPLADPRPYEPPEAPLAHLQAMLATMGLERVVVAHVSAHGLDLSVTLDAVAGLGDRARGTALLRSDVGNARLDDLHAGGIRGVRLSMAYGADTPLDEAHLLGWAERVAPLGWHLAVWPQDLAQLRMLERLAPRLAAPLVLDHLAAHGWFADGRVQHDGLAVLEGLLATGRAWLKLSGMYRAGAGPAPWQPLVKTLAALVRRHLHRMLWASDWPYVGLHDAAVRPRSGDLLDWLQRLGLDAAARRQVLVRNPETLYGFTPAPEGALSEGVLASAAPTQDLTDG
ncbi:MAG TPA: amidohydrolase family protein [Ramlibacter sp.]|nr:amidohydrolase family protein [Ramlibacter sp.]